MSKEPQQRTQQPVVMVQVQQPSVVQGAPVPVPMKLSAATGYVQPQKQGGMMEMTVVGPSTASLGEEGPPPPRYAAPPGYDGYGM